MLPARDSLKTLRHIQPESEGMEKQIPCKWKLKKKKSQDNNAYIIQIMLENNDNSKSQRRALHNNKAINQSITMVKSRNPTQEHIYT